MEEGVRRVLAVLVCLTAAAALGQEESASRVAQFEKAFPRVAKNAAAEDLEALGRALGFDPGGAAAEGRPANEDRDALLNCGHSTWLDAQLSTSDDSILPPPTRFVAFLESREAALWHVVRLLEKDTPEWEFDLHKKRDSFPELLFVAQLNRLLLSTALLEEQAGRHAEAADLLEASWSLARSAARRPELIYQLIALASLRSLSGALRKMAEPRPEWSDRMSSHEPVQGILNSLRADSLISFSRNGSLAEHSFDSFWVRSERLFAEKMKDLSVCEISTMSSEAIWQPVIEELRRSANEEESAELQVIGENFAPSLTNALQRAARLVIESELTARIVDLRLQKAASRPSRWPENLYDTDSRACPGAEYEYRSFGGAMAIRFKGSVGKLDVPRLLPLSFEARAPKPSPTAIPTRGASPTPTPSPSLTPLKAGA